jgi:hypothetical protein
MRLSSTLLSGLLWAAGVTEAVNVTENQKVLDATLDFHVLYSVPVIEVLHTDGLKMFIKNGTVNCTCGTPGLVVFELSRRVVSCWCVLVVCRDRVYRTRYYFGAKTISVPCYIYIFIYMMRLYADVKKQFNNAVLL